MEDHTTEKRTNDGDNFSIITTLQGHSEPITGIVLPPEGDELYSSSKDGTLRVWNCHTGRCEDDINIGSQIYSLSQGGDWIFIGLLDLIKAWNIQTGVVFNLKGVKGQVHTMIFHDNMLFAATLSGQILAWKFTFNIESPNPFYLTHILEGPNRKITCISIGCGMLYSGAWDGTIKKWDMGCLQCIATVKGHSSAVTSLVCWDQYLVSSSWDQTIKTWSSMQGGGLELYYTHKEKQVVLSFSGMNIPVTPKEAARHDILFCSCGDNFVHLYELPSFQKRGRIFARQGAGSVHIFGGQFFIGDGTGLITVGKIAC